MLRGKNKASAAQLAEAKERREWFATMQAAIRNPVTLTEDAISEHERSDNKSSAGEDRSNAPSAVPSVASFASMPSFLSGFDNSATQKDTLAISNDIDVIYDDIHKWLIKLNNVPVENIKANVVCFPGIGHNHSYFARWSVLLGAGDIQLYGVCIPGRSNRILEKPANSMKEVSKRVTQAIRIFVIGTEENDDDEDDAADADGRYERDRRLDDKKPASGSRFATAGGEASRKLTAHIPKKRKPNLVLLGHDMGSLLAFETVRLLQQQQQVTHHLIVSATRPPLQQTAYNLTPTRMNDETEMLEFVKYHTRPDKELVDEIFKYDGLPPIMQERRDLFRKFLPLIRSDFKLLETFVVAKPNLYGAQDDSESDEEVDSEGRTILSAARTKSALYRVKTAIHTVCALDDPVVSLEEVEEWREFTSSEFTSETCEYGGHNYLRFDENQSMIGEFVKEVALRINDDDEEEEEEENNDDISR